MSNVHPFKPQQALQAIERARTNSDNPPQEPSFGGGSGAPPMDARITKLENLVEKTNERLVFIEKDVAVIKSNYASKEDLARVEGSMKAAIAESKNSIIMWVVSAFMLAQLLPVLLSQLGKLIK